MSDVEKLFNKIVHDLPMATEGKIFGAKSIKSTTGKTAAFLLNESMVFKLDPSSRNEALKLKGSKIGSHIYAPDRPMKAWVEIHKSHSSQWSKYSTIALKYVESLKK